MSSRPPPFRSKEAQNMSDAGNAFEENELEETHPIENYEQVRRWFLNL